MNPNRDIENYKLYAVEISIDVPLATTLMGVPDKNFESCWIHSILETENPSLGKWQEASVDLRWRHRDMGT